jgi:hypothetical protein
MVKGTSVLDDAWSDPHAGRHNGGPVFTKILAGVDETPGAIDAAELAGVGIDG